MRKFVICLVFTAICISTALGISCLHCGRVIGNRCEVVENLPQRTCPDWSLEERELLGIKKPVCIRTERTVKNVTFYDRKCGQVGGENDTCELEREKFEGIPIKCFTCDLDWCNGSYCAFGNLTFLLLSVTVVMVMKLI